MGEHRLDAAAVLAQQPVERVEPFLDRDQAPGIGLDPLGVVAQLAGDVGQLDRERLEALGDRVEARVDSAYGLQLSLGPGQRGDRAAAVLVGAGGLGVGARRRLAQSLRVAQPLALGRQLGRLGGVRGDLLDLGELIPVEIEVALA